MALREAGIGGPLIFVGDRPGRKYAARRRAGAVRRIVAGATAAEGPIRPARGGPAERGEEGV
jgi:hypothetical protein